MFGRMIMLPPRGGWPKEAHWGTAHIFTRSSVTDPRGWALLSHPAAIDGQLLTFGREEGLWIDANQICKNMICSPMEVYSKAPPRLGP